MASLKVTVTLDAGEWSTLVAALESYIGLLESSDEEWEEDLIPARSLLPKIEAAKEKAQKRTPRV